MAKQLKSQVKGKSGISRIDPRLVELVKHLARQAAERDYKDLQSIANIDRDAHGNGVTDS